VVRRLAVAVLLLVIAMGSTLAQQDVTLSVLPSAESVDAGGLVYVEISVDSQVEVYAAQYSLRFDTSAFEAFSQEQGEYLSSDGNSPTVLINRYNNINGTVEYGEFRKDTSTGISGSGVLSTITLRVKDDAPSGDYELYLYDVVLAGIPNAEQIENVGTVSGEVYVNGTEEQPQTQQSPTSGEISATQATPTETPTSTAVGAGTPEPTRTASESSQTSASSSSALPKSTPAPTAVLAVLALLGAFLITRRR